MSSHLPLRTTTIRPLFDRQTPTCTPDGGPPRRSYAKIATVDPVRRRAPRRPGFQNRRRRYDDRRTVYTGNTYGFLKEKRHYFAEVNDQIHPSGFHFAASRARAAYNNAPSGPPSESSDDYYFRRLRRTRREPRGRNRFGPRSRSRHLSTTQRGIEDIFYTVHSTAAVVAHTRARTQGGAGQRLCC